MRWSGYGVGVKNGALLPAILLIGVMLVGVPIALEHPWVGVLVAVLNVLLLPWFLKAWFADEGRAGRDESST